MGSLLTDGQTLSHDYTAVARPRRACAVKNASQIVELVILESWILQVLGNWDRVIVPGERLALAVKGPRPQLDLGARRPFAFQMKIHSTVSVHVSHRQRDREIHETRPGFAWDHELHARERLQPSLVGNRQIDRDPARAVLNARDLVGEFELLFRLPQLFAQPVGWRGYEQSESKHEDGHAEPTQGHRSAPSPSDDHPRIDAPLQTYPVRDWFRAQRLTQPPQSPIDDVAGRSGSRVSSPGGPARRAH